MENLVALRGRSVFVTGHTGFKGGWLALWLAELGARVHGYALMPPTRPSLFEVGRVAEVLASDTRADLADLDSLRQAILRARPSLVFHLAAQPLVSCGYRDPIGTIGSNVMGSANLLEAIRGEESVEAVVMVATDKVYENRENGDPFAEDHALGGRDPYSASKAAAELIVSAYRSSYFGDGGHPARIGTARAGNVVGGGDWSPNRLVPDCLLAFGSGSAVSLRNPGAIRPWQHVLGPLSGYLTLGSRLLGSDGEAFARAWNFGPDPDDDATAGQVAHKLAELWGRNARVDRDGSGQFAEAQTLRLDSTKARTGLGWKPAWSLDEALKQTIAWHQAWLDGEDMQAVSTQQIVQYTAAQ